MQRRPAVRVRARGVRPALQQQRDEPAVAGGGGHAEQVVAVRATRRGELGEAIEQRAQAVEVVRLDGAVGARERLAALAQATDVAAQRRPAREPVLAGDDVARARARQRRAASGRTAPWRFPSRPARTRAARPPAPRSSPRPRGTRAAARGRARRPAVRTRPGAASSGSRARARPRVARPTGAAARPASAPRRPPGPARRGRPPGRRAAGPWPACATAPGSARAAGMRSRQPPFRRARGPRCSGGEEDAAHGMGSRWASPSRGRGAASTARGQSVMDGRRPVKVLACQKLDVRRASRPGDASSSSPRSS